MFKSILVVCVGNICRSPLGERALAARLPGLTVESAGLAAVVGHEADKEASTAAAEAGISLDGHIARQLTAEVGGRYDLILVMEAGHRSEVTRRFPQLSGRTMLFDKWNGEKSIADPYRKTIDFHRVVRDQIIAAADGWAKRLSR